MLVRGGPPSGPETEQGLKRGHGLPAPIVAKDEFNQEVRVQYSGPIDHDLVRFGLRLVRPKSFLGARNSRFWPTD
jgi:hypothetical protein